MHGPADDAPGEDIQDGDKIQPTLSGEDASRVGGPDLVGAFERESSNAVRRDGSAVAAVGRGPSIFGTLPSEDALRAHETGNTVAPSRTAQRTSQPRAAISLTTAGKLFSDALAQADVLQLARTRSVRRFFQS